MVDRRIRVADPLFSTIEHSSNHFTYKRGLHALWMTVIGLQTLTNPIAGIFSGESSARASVKNGLEKAWDMIKNEVYITDTVMQPIAYIMNRLIMMTSLLILGFSVHPVLVSVFIYVGVNFVVFVTMQMYFGWLD